MFSVRSSTIKITSLVLIKHFYHEYHRLLRHVSTFITMKHFGIVVYNCIPNVSYRFPVFQDI